MLVSRTRLIRTTMQRNPSLVSKSLRKISGNVVDCAPLLDLGTLELSPTSEEFDGIRIVARDTSGNIVTVPIKVRSLWFF
jgi:hypothetical protein